MAEVKSVKTQSAKYVMDEITSLYFSYMQPPKPKTYEVQRGDTLSEIAKQHNTTIQEIAKLNHIKNPNIIYPEQILILPQKKQQPSKQVKLQGTLIPLGSKVLIVAQGTPNKEATIEVLADKIPFKVLKDGQEVSNFKVTFDASGQSVTEVTLRPRSDTEFKALIDKFSPQLGQGIYTEKITLKAQMNNPYYEVSLANDDMNKLGLNLYQTYIKRAYIVNKTTGAIQATLTAQQDGNEIVLIDEETGEPAVKTTLDAMANAFGNMNNAAGGLAAGMKYVDGTFALTNSKGISLKHYESGWHGNGAVKTYSMAKWAQSLDKGTFYISLVIGVYQINSAMNQDEGYLDENNITKSQILPNIGEETEQTAGSVLAGFGGGVIAGRIAGFALGVIFLPAEVPAALALGTFIVVGTAVGWAVSEGSAALIEWEQKREGDTIINDYPLRNR